MSPAWSIAGSEWWIVVGGSLQALGVVVLVVDVTASFRRLRTYRHREKKVPIGQAVETDMAFPITPVGGKQPTLEERIDRLEGQVRELRIELQETAARLRSDARDAASDAAQRVWHRSDDQFRALEGALLGDTRKDKVRRLASIAAIAFGVVLATIGSVAP